jgi:UDP-N-acetylmuramoyl-L-alanyl-D-glutamate--2,6-diaminopimelate ligase
MGQIASRMSEITIVTSDNPRSEPPERIMDEIEKGIDMTETRYIRESNRGQAIRLALSLARTNDLVLVAGKGHESYQIVGDQEFPFDDREVISEYLSQCTLQLP